MTPYRSTQPIVGFPRAMAILIVLMLMVSSVSLVAQSAAIQFEALTIDQGLSQGTINAILQDKRGFLWFATQDGLNRYDGYKFRVFKHHHSARTTLSNSYIWALCEDAQGFLWIGTNGGGLNKYNPRSGVFTSYPAEPSNPQGLSSNAVTCVAVDSSGCVWVGTADRGLNKFDPAANNHRGAFTQYHLADGLPDEAINAVLVEPSGAVWVATNNGGLAKFIPSSGQWTVFRCPPAAGRALQQSSQQSFQQQSSRQASEKQGSDNVANTSLPSNAVSSLCWVNARGGGSADALYAGTSEGLTRIAYKAGKPVLTTFRTIANDTRSLSNNDVLSLHQRHSGYLLVGTRGGVVHFDPSREEFSTWSTSSGNTSGLLSNTIRSVHEDRQGIVWIGTYGSGINKYSPRRYAFATVRHQIENENSVSSDVIWSFLEDQRGMIWVGTFNDGLNRYNPQTRTWSVFRASDQRAKTLSNNTVNALAEDKSGRIWVGTNDGLNVLDQTKQAFTVYRNNPANPQSLSHNEVKTVFCDANGIIWVGTKGGGLNRLEIKTEEAAEKLTWKQYRNNPANPQSLSHDQVNCIIGSRDGTLWVGTSGGGLNNFDKTTGKCTVYRHDPLNSKTLSNNYIRSLYEDRNGTLWVGTLGGGLCKLDRQTGAFTTYQEKDGLPNDVVYGILEDDAGYLWLSTNQGLSRFHPAKNTFRNYTDRDGLQSNEFNTGAYLKTRDGHLYFGGMKGFNAFFADSVRDNDYVPPVVLTNFQKFNKPAALDSEISAVSRIELGVQDVFFSLEFAALNFDAPEQNQYRYKLEGFDKNWIEAGTKREATYTNLDGGTYTFRVKGSNNHGIWNEQGLTLTIVVHPPWWETWWFRVGAVIALIVLIVLWYRWRTQQIRHQKAVLQREVDERTADLNESNQEIQRQLSILDNQAREIEMANSELQMVNTWMEEKNHALALLNTEKNEIMGIVAHDLKNPLSNIRLIAKMLRKDAKTLAAGDVQEFATDIETSAERMFDLITNLLNVNAIDQGGIKLDLSAFDLTALVYSVVENYRPAAEAKNIQLRFDAAIKPDGSPQWLCYADRSASVQTFDNLISNAVKYSPLGKSVYVRVHPSDDAQRLRVEVQDEGQGLSEEDMKKLFGKFARLSARPTGGEHSTGLGLSIVKRLVEAMKGNVWCESKPGEGANFIVELPLYRG